MTKDSQHGIQKMSRMARWAGLAAVICLATLSHAQSVSQTLAPSFSALGELSVSPGTVTMTPTGTIFNPFTSGPVSVNYCIRTSSSGTGSITVLANSDFAPSGGPTVSNLTYSCSVSGTGTACSGTQTVSTSVGTPVVSVGAAASTAGGTACTTNHNTGTLNFSLVNLPSYGGGTAYSVTLTFTISAS
jgi:hypothetical protein